MNNLKEVFLHRIEVTKLMHRCGLIWQPFAHDLSYYWHCKELSDCTSRFIWYEQHKKESKHHYEHWIVDGVPVEIPNKYIVEIVCNMIAAEKVRKGNDYKSSDPFMKFVKLCRKEGKSLKMTDRTVHIINTLLTLVANNRGDRFIAGVMRRIIKGENI